MATGGWLWVDFFFVLSGFVIAASCGERLASGFAVRRFMLLRLGRIYPLHITMLADLALAATVLVFARERGAISRVLLQRWALLLGTLSYSLYMVHVFVIARGMDALRWLGLGEVTFDQGVQARRILAAPWLADGLGLAVLAACVPVAWLTWRFIEWPARAWSRRRAARMGVGAEEAVAPTI